MRRKGRLRWQKSLAMTAAVILILTATSFVMMEWIVRREEANCFARLYQEAEQLAENIRDRAENDREHLKVLASVIGKYEEAPAEQLWDYLNTYHPSGIMSRLELLLPGDVVLRQGGVRIDAAGVLSFEEEAKKGAHISDREPDLEGEGYVVRNYAPIVRDGETVAMLYGVTELEELPQELRANPYGGQASVYIIDGSNGDFLVDTWHSEPGNIWELGEREMASGYDQEQLKQSLTDGETGYVIFVSESVGENLYFFFAPVEVNEWRIALSVPEHVVMADASQIRTVLNQFLVLGAVVFLLYFLWMIRHVMGETEEKQRQLDMISYIYDVQQLLFGAHEHQENITAALDKIGHFISADHVILWVQQSGVSSRFEWAREGKHLETDRSQAAEALESYFARHKGALEAYDGESIRRQLPGWNADGVKSLAAIPVEGRNGISRGILAGCNLTGRRADIVSLTSVNLSFQMLLHNMSSYDTIKKQGERDLLLGLYNRNRYELDRARYAELFLVSLACVYIDVNGLHEINNTKGHDAGDEMLKRVAEQIRSVFGDTHAYRIGGDEFLVFVPDMLEDAVMRLGKRLEEELQKEHIFISLGIQWEESPSSADALIRAAEQKMFLSKRAFYEQKEHDRRRRDRT